MNDDRDRPEDDDAEEDDADTITSSDDPSLSEYDKTMADSFPASDPPAQP